MKITGPKRLLVRSYRPSFPKARPVHVLEYQKAGSGKMLELGQVIPVGGEHFIHHLLNFLQT